MFGGLDALFPALDAPSVGGALGLLSVGLWMIRVQRVAAYVRLGGLLVVLVAAVLVAGGVSGVVRLDMGALVRIAETGAHVGTGVFRALTGVFAGGGA